jgi:putative ABC transport system substrate-binding protein
MKTGMRHEAIGTSKNARVFGFALCTIFALCSSAHAQQLDKIQKIGWLAARPFSSGSGRELFAREIRALGYVEGKNISFEYRSAENKIDRLPALADELVRLKVDVLFAPAGNEARAAKKATSTIPIVFASVGDPIEAGLVKSLARPGGNVTGFTTIAPVLAGKRLEWLKETVPTLSRVAVLWNPISAGSRQSWKESRLAAQGLNLKLYSCEVSHVNELDGAFHGAVKFASRALSVISSPFINTHQKRVIDLAVKHRLPAIYAREDFADNGGLMSYGADRSDPYRRAAVYVDKIFKGVKPADLPVEQPTRFEFVINLKTAKQIGLTIPPNVLARADRVIR